MGTASAVAEKPRSQETGPRKVRNWGSLDILAINERFYTLWLKSVWAVNLETHCFESLVGRRDWRVKKDMLPTAGQKPIWLRPGIYYLCGVVGGNQAPGTGKGWARNLHLAFQWAPELGAQEIALPRDPFTQEAQALELPGMVVRLNGFEPLLFSEADCDPADPHFDDPAFRTCRNWQFAHKLANAGALSRQPRTLRELGGRCGH